jgi:hypothetical protein
VLALIVGGCTRSHGRVASASATPALEDGGGTAPPSQPQPPPLMLGTPVLSFDAGPPYLCDGGTTLDPRPETSEYRCYGWDDFAQHGSWPNLKNDAGASSLGTRDAFRCPGANELWWNAGGESCGYMPICDQVTTSQVAVDDDAGHRADEQRCCYILSRWCGV